MTRKRVFSRFTTITWIRARPRSTRRTREPAAFYGRKSDKKSRKTSIEDQFRNCQEGAAEKGCYIPQKYIYIDENKTGTTKFNRPGLAALLAICI
jgi:DNA invertase Pin-like site-specific DNA recombinase